MRSPTPTAEAEHSSKRARRKAEYVCEDPLLTAAESAPETGRALSTFWRDVRLKKLPPPYYVTPRSPRWRRSELRAAVDATRARPAQDVQQQEAVQRQE